MVGCRTLLSLSIISLHLATHILRDAVQSKQPIAVFEFQRPSLFHLPLRHIQSSVLSALWLHSFHTPFTWKVLTIAPRLLDIVLDGIVSALLNLFHGRTSRCCYQSW